MAYFPFFVELAEKRGLIVGGGAVALRKVRKLLPYGPRLTVVAPDIAPEICKIPEVEVKKRGWRPEDVQACDFAIAATGNREVNRQVAERGAALRIPVNVVDRAEDGSFVFPALLRQGALSIGISTGGSFPLAGVYVKEKVQSLLPAQTEQVIDWLCIQRARLRQDFPDSNRRNRVLQALCQAAMEQGRVLSEAEVKAVQDAVQQGEGG